MREFHVLQRNVQVVSTNSTSDIGHTHIPWSFPTIHTSKQSKDTKHEGIADKSDSKKISTSILSFVVFEGAYLMGQHLEKRIYDRKELYQPIESPLRHKHDSAIKRHIR